MTTTQSISKKKKSSINANLHQHTDLESMTDQIRDRYEELLEQTSDPIDETGNSSLAFIKKYPFYTLAGVVAIGAAATLYLKTRRV